MCLFCRWNSYFGAGFIVNKIYIDTNVILRANKIGYWQFIKLARYGQLILAMPAIREIKRISIISKKLVWVLVERKIIILENPAGKYANFDAFILNCTNFNYHLITLDRKLLHRYYGNSNPKFTVRRNKFWSEGNPI